ncbi:hypothetical protein [Campylobacter concisus]|uniref:hypothetical protein n=1 Tax=Campylobacter concisus TaxID=199 RepID=UPI00215609D6|nr:hypothetical protein [Campylobacter concisus]
MSAFKQMLWQILRKFMSMKIYTSKKQASGNFELGSTIVILSEKDAIEYNLFENKELKFAEAIGRIKE